MICFPNAKINIGLNITEKRPDNFHNIETVFYSIPLSDVLEIVPLPKNTEPKVELKISGMDIPGNPDTNLCVKAYKLIDADFDLPPVKILLHKLTPMGAGLGGGSSDGAFTLTTLNNLFELGLTEKQLIDYASQLGSDCPFFIGNTPAYGTEKGNNLTPISVAIKGLFMVLVKPNVFVGTAEAYAGVKPEKPAISVDELIKRPIHSWRNAISNDFEKSIFANHPEIAQIKDQLYAEGAIYASMSGSGSSVYGIFDTNKFLKDKFPGCFYWGGEI